MKKLKLFQSRRFKHGSMATVMTILFVVAVVVINLIASLILDRIPSSVDLTSDKIYQLTEDSIDYAKNIKEDVNIIICADETDLAASTYGKQVTEIIGNYAKQNSKISVRYTDLLKEPEIATKYSDYSVEEYSVIVTTDKRTKVMDMNDFIETKTDSSTQQQSYWSSAEKNMTSALMYVTDDSVMKASVLTGHSEVGAAGLTTMLTDNNYQVTEQNISTEEIDQDASMVMIYAPTTDYTDQELQKLDKFLDNDGKFDKTVVYVAAPNQPELPNLKTFLAEWGIEVGNGVLMDTNSKNVYDSTGNAAIFGAEYTEEDYTTDLRDATLPYLSNYSRPISTTFSEDGNRSAKLLMSSPETSVVYPLDSEEDFDLTKAEQGSHGVVALGQRTKYEGTEAHISNVLVFGSTLLFSDNLISDARFNNNEYAINVINKLSGKEDTLNISSVSFDTAKLSVTQASYTAVSIVFTAVIPLATLAIGIFIWIRRRHK